MPANPLSTLEREHICCCLARGERIAEIAVALGRCKSTVYRELKRNGGRGVYSAVLADQRATSKRKRPRVSKLVADRALLDHICWRLQELDSPMTISIELARGVRGVLAQVSHETIYRAIYKLKGLLGPEIVTPHLRRRSRKHRGQRVPGSHSLGQFWPIRDRPPAADDRSEFGHIEGDLITGRMNRSALITLNDRRSRLVWIQPTKSKKADDVFDGLIEVFARIPIELRKTLTWDQGSELARWPELAQQLNIDIYIADAKSPWQRPTNENSNAHIRRYVGKGTNLNLIAAQRLLDIEYRINTTPRHIHNWHSATDYYNQHVALIS